MRAEDREIGFSDDLGLHPRHLAEHHRELLVGLDINENFTCDAEVRAQVEMSGHVVFLLAMLGGYEAVGDEEEFFETDGFACLAEASGIPLESSVYVADVQIEINARVGYTSIAVVEIEVDEPSLSWKFEHVSWIKYC